MTSPLSGAAAIVGIGAAGAPSEPIFGGRGEIRFLYVDPDFKRRGIGRMLLRGLARRCVEEGLGRLEWSVLDWNDPAIGFYRAQGAEILGDWRVCRMTGAALETAGAP